MLIAGCTTTAPVTSTAPRLMIVQIHNSGNTYDTVMELINRQTHLRSVRIVDTDIFFGSTQQMEIEVDFINTKQLSTLQTELFRIRGIIGISIL